MTPTAPFIALGEALVRELHGPLLIGYSGGLDSGVLLHALAGQAQVRSAGLRAIHVHHGLQAHADAWARHCAAVCNALGVDLVTAHVSVDREFADGLEAAARAARYAAFEDALAPGATLVTAHHRDDQAETFLLRALRGSGPDGLVAMQAWRPFAAGQHWRPLLDTPRSALLAYAQAHSLHWLDDPSNDETRHDRNFLRHQIMPLLRERWPQADAAFTRSAGLMADATSLLQGEDAKALALASTADPQALAVPALRAMPAARRARVLRRWVEGLKLPPLPYKGVDQIEADLLTARSDARARFAWRGTVIHRWRDLLHAQAAREPLDPQWQQQWDGAQTLGLPGGDTLSLHGAQALPWPVQVCARSGGERITLPGREHSHSLKHVLQEFGIPPWEREVLPLLRDEEGGLLAVADLVYSARFDAWLREHGARLHWRRAA